MLKSQEVALYFVFLLENVLLRFMVEIYLYGSSFDLHVGTTKIKNLDDNISSLRLNLTKEDLEEISNAAPLTEVAGARVPDLFNSTSWQFADTPARV